MTRDFYIDDDNIDPFENVDCSELLFLIEDFENSSYIDEETMNEEVKGAFLAIDEYVFPLSKKDLLNLWDSSYIWNENIDNNSFYVFSVEYSSKEGFCIIYGYWNETQEFLVFTADNLDRICLFISDYINLRTKDTSQQATIEDISDLKEIALIC